MKQHLQNEVFEKYIFDLIPDIPRLPNLPTVITDETLAEYFSLTKEQRYKIDSLHKKNYNWDFKKKEL